MMVKIDRINDLSISISGFPWKFSGIEKKEIEAKTTVSKAIKKIKMKQRNKKLMGDVIMPSLS